MERAKVLRKVFSWFSDEERKKPESEKGVMIDPVGQNKPQNIN
jgi:hypothetical protein